MPFLCYEGGDQASAALKRRTHSLKARDILKLVWKALEDKKGHDLVTLDLRKLSSVADYFVLASGASERHVRTLAEHVMEALEAHRVSNWHVEGLAESRWVLIDYGDIIIHVFHPQARSFYGLERLWGEASTVEVKGA